MKYYYLNKIAMAVLVALLLFFGTRTLINIAYEEHEPEKPGFEVAGGEGKPGAEAKKPEEPGEEIIAALQTADPAKGEQDVALCKVCHTFDKGGAALVGPNLYGIVGTKIAEGRGGFNFTPALKKHDGQDWTFQNLDLWLTNPQAFASGTTMAFPGIPDLKKRADVIAFLNKNSDSPLPIPKPKPKPKPEEKAAAGGEKPAGGPGADTAAFLAAVAKADPKKGESDAMLCKVCHTFDKGGAVLVGPNLYGIVGDKIAEGRGGFSFTPALKKHEGAKWTYANLDAWLTNPQAFAPGTTMAFPGIKDTKKRAAVVAWLRTVSDNPVPLPEAAPAAEEKPAAPAAEEKPAPEEKPAAEEPKAEEEPAAPAAEEKPAPEEKPAAPAAEEKPAPEEKPAAPAAEEKPAPEEKPAAPAAEEKPAAPPTVSPDAPHEPSKGEPPSPSQPQPVYPDKSSSAGETTGEGTTDKETTAAPPTVSPDAPHEPSKGEPPSASQPQPVYPDEKPAMDGAGSTAPSGDDSLASQPQPVYPDGKPEGL